MTFFEKIQAIERIDQLIRLKATGTPRDLAQRIGVSRTTIYEIIHCMKMLGAEIEYCRHRQSFYYTSSVKLAIGYSKPDENYSSILGGRKKNHNIYFPSGFPEQPLGIFELNRNQRH